MKVLVIGGASLVGTMIVQRLAREHQVRVADLRRRDFGEAIESVVADVTDVESLRAAVDGQDAVVYLAMGLRAPWGATGGWAESQFDVNVKRALSGAAHRGRSRHPPRGLLEFVVDLHAVLRPRARAAGSRARRRRRLRPDQAARRAGALVRIRRRRPA